MVSRYFFPKNSSKIGHAAFFPATSKKSFFRFRQKVVCERATTTLRRPFPVEKRWRRSENNACFIDFVPFLGQFMSNHRLKCLAEGLIVTKTSFDAGFWCLSRIKRSTRLPNRTMSVIFDYLFLTCWGPAVYFSVRLTYGLKPIFLGIRTLAAYIRGRLTIQQIL